MWVDFTLDSGGESTKERSTSYNVREYTWGTGSYTCNINLATVCHLTSKVSAVGLLPLNRKRSHIIQQTRSIN
jgi:hypothetical protein